MNRRKKQNAGLLGAVAQKKVGPRFNHGQITTGSTSQQAAQFNVESAPAAPTPGTRNLFNVTSAPGGTRGSAPPAQTQNPPPGPVDPYSVSSYNPASGNPDPRDASYFANLAKLQATAHQDTAGGLLEQNNADVNYNQQLGSMASDRQTNIRNVAESMIGRGLLRSGYHDRSQTEATGKYLEALSGVQSAKGQDDAARAAKMNAILSNLGIDEQGLYADSASRYADLQRQAADKQTPTAPVTYPSEPAPSTPANKNKKKNKKKKNK